MLWITNVLEKLHDFKFLLFSLILFGRFLLVSPILIHHKTNRTNDYIHYFSNHSDKIRRGILIGSFLRALRICSLNDLNNEFDYNIKSFSKHQYPDPFIIIILSCHQHGYPWPSLATLPYRLSLLGGPHIDAVYRFQLVALLLLGHVRGSMNVHHLWARPCFSCIILYICFI